jgi:hypothetical protein
VTQKATQEDVEVAGCQITGYTGLVKLLLWGRFVTKVINDQTYDFVNLRLKTNHSKTQLK